SDVHQTRSRTRPAAQQRTDHAAQHASFQRLWTALGFCSLRLLEIGIARGSADQRRTRSRRHGDGAGPGLRTEGWLAKEDAASRRRTIEVESSRPAAVS